MEKNGVNTRSKSTTQVQLTKSNGSSTGTPTTSSSVLAKSSSQININVSHLSDMENNIVHKLESLIDKKLEAIKQCILQAVSEKLNSILSDFNLLKKKVDDIDIRLSAIEKNNTANSCTSDDINRLKRINDIIISGIPYVKHEKPIEIFNNIAKCINATTSPYISAYRIKSKFVKSNKDGTNSSSAIQGGPIIVKLSCEAERSAFLTKLKNHKKSLTLADINCGFTSFSKINIFESLTSRDDAIRRKARQLRKDGKILSVSTSNGIVCVKMKKHESYIKITNIEQFDILLANSVKSDAAVTAN